MQKGAMRFKQVQRVIKAKKNFGVRCTLTSGGSRGGARGPPPPLFWVKNEEMTEGKMADRASKSKDTMQKTVD